MHFNPTIVAAILACTLQVAAAPVPQLAGVGQGCDSVFTETDNGAGYGVEYAEEGLASNLKSAHRRRQLAGVGSGCNSVFTQTDNGVGYGVEYAEDGIAKLINPNSNPSTGGGSSGAPAPAPGPGPAPAPGPGPAPAPGPNGPKSRRQLDKISNGFQAISEAAGMGSSTSAMTTELDNLDGAGTSGSAQLGAEIGDLEVSTLEGAGKSIPKRQLDKISNGFQAISEAAGMGSSTSAMTTELDNLDGAGTSGSAQLGAEIGDLEVSTLEGIGKSVPK